MGVTKHMRVSPEHLIVRKELTDRGLIERTSAGLSVEFEQLMLQALSAKSMCIKIQK